MNKDVVYIEPEEDITDIISKIEGSKSKIVALVPPKKAGVFKSIVNIKLITKTGTNAKKTVVLVTTDPAIVKLAAATKIPVTKDLQTAPTIPEMDEVEDDDVEVVEVDDEAEEAKDTKKGDDEDNTEEDSEEAEDDSKDDEDDSEDDDPEEDKKDNEDDKDAKKGKKDAKKKDDAKNKEAKGKLANSNNPVLKWIGTHKKITAGIGVGLVFLIIACVWAFGIMPAVTVTLKLETTTGNFSENISFTDKLADEKVEEGKFYIEEKKLENKAEAEFEATGKKNVGEKASGEIVASYHFPIDSAGGTVGINTGSVFTVSGLNFVATANASISWDGNLADVKTDCENYSASDPGWKHGGCKVSTKVKVTAAEPGANYNIGANAGTWTSAISGINASNPAAITGGSDKTVTIVQQSDIDKAMKDITAENESVSKQKLLDTIPEEQFVIDSSFKQTVSDPVATPAVGAEVEEGKKAKLAVTTTDTIFVIDETKLKEFISEKAKLDKGFKIYEMNDPFVESFTKTDSGYTGKLKTSYVAGPTITENEVVDEIKGKGIGTAKRDLADKFSGIKTITIDTSAPWVSSVPGNVEKITVNINVEE